MDFGWLGTKKERKNSGSGAGLHAIRWLGVPGRLRQQQEYWWRQPRHAGRNVRDHCHWYWQRCPAGFPACLGNPLSAPMRLGDTPRAADAGRGDAGWTPQHAVVRPEERQLHQQGQTSADRIDALALAQVGDFLVHLLFGAPRMLYFWIALRGHPMLKKAFVSNLSSTRARARTPRLGTWLGSQRCYPLLKGERSQCSNSH